MEHYKLLIGGELVDAADGARNESIDPGSGEVVATCARASAREAEQAVDAAVARVRIGRLARPRSRPSARASMMDLADRIQENATEIGIARGARQRRRDAAHDRRRASWARA